MTRDTTKTLSTTSSNKVRKQISLTVDLNTWKALQHYAAKHKKSMTQVMLDAASPRLCEIREWYEENYP